MSAASRKSRMATSVARVMYTNAVYFPSSRIYQGDSPGMLNYSCINHVYYAYASVTADGNVFVSLDQGPEATICQSGFISPCNGSGKIENISPA
jgi:GH18 family chitinase